MNNYQIELKFKRQIQTDPDVRTEPLGFGFEIDFTSFEHLQDNMDAYLLQFRAMLTQACSYMVK